MNSLAEILSETFRIKESDYHEETELMQFKEWDSMAHMMLITRLEENYNIVLDGDEIAEMNSVGKIRGILQKHGVKNP